MNHETATWREVEQFIASRPAIAVLPVGAHEQHGAHLPLSTDTIMATGLAQRLSESLDAMLLPALPYGETWSTSGYHGTISLSFNTLVAIVVDIGTALANQNVVALVVVNGHFGNQAPLEQASRILHDQHDFPVLVVNYPGIESAAAVVCESVPVAPGFFHAEEVETSVVLALQPETVHMDRAEPEYPPFPPAFGATPIQLHTFCTSGVFGDPRPATAAKGAQLLDILAASALELAQAFLVPFLSK